MGRLTREESRAVTRDRLVTMARLLFRRDGFTGTSLDRIADEAGYSKGAVYSNFENKESIFLAAIEAEGRHSLDEVCTAMDDAATTEQLIEAVASWATEQSHHGNWALPVLEYARHSAAAPKALKQQEDIIRDCWRQLGARLVRRFPHLTAQGEMVGALLYEISHAPVMAIIDSPTSGDLIRLSLRALLTPPAAKDTPAKPRARTRRPVQ